MLLKYIMGILGTLLQTQHEQKEMSCFSPSFHTQPEVMVLKNAEYSPLTGHLKVVCCKDMRHVHHATGIKLVWIRVPVRMALLTHHP